MTAGAPLLAVYGGSPTRSTPMPARYAIGPDERAMINEALDFYQARGADPGYQGPFEERYNHLFAELLGGGYADAVATGTMALYVALKALDLPVGSTVLVSPITDPGSLSAIILAGFVPKLVDSAPGGYNIGAEQVAARLTPDVSATMVIHSLGRAADITGIIDMCRGHGVKVLEDCSQSHGARWQGKPVGSFGDVAAFSTMYRKTSITGASGGVVFSRDIDIYHRALAHADRGKPRWIDGFDDRDPSRFLFPAFNLHTDELSCAIGIASLTRLEDTRARRLAYVMGVMTGLNGVSQVCCPGAAGIDDSPFVYPIYVDVTRLECDKIEFARAVLAEGIGLNPHYRYLARDWPWLLSYLADDFETVNARTARDSSFCLYLNEAYGEPEIADTVAAILKVERHFRP